ncbi:MAG: NAD(P)-binding domain-containing protein, partial [Cyclobacteriaceae bacterium]|nr:NAD(P)-binding domain-containing protein [Cyclobacteriaceae bacterium]
MEKIGFIGLGIMGQPMSLHLLKGGHEVTVLQSSASADALAAEGAKLVSSPREVAENSDVVITCLPD